MCRETSTVRGAAWATVGSTTLKAGPMRDRLDGAGLDGRAGWLHGFCRGRQVLGERLPALVARVNRVVQGRARLAGQPERPGADADHLQDRPDRAVAAAPPDQAGVRQLRQGSAGRRPGPGQGLQRRRDRRAPSPATSSRRSRKRNYTQYASAAAQAAVKTVERLGQLLPCAANVQANNEADLCLPVHPPVRPPRLSAAAGRRRGQPLRVGVPGGPEQRRLHQRHRAGRPGHARVAALPVPGGRPGAADPAPAGGRLSYFLWNAPPDAKLSSLADGGALRTPEALRDEAKRMLADPQGAGDDRRLPHALAGSWRSCRS